MVLLIIHKLRFHGLLGRFYTFDQKDSMPSDPINVPQKDQMAEEAANSLPSTGHKSSSTGGNLKRQSDGSSGSDDTGIPVQSSNFWEFVINNKICNDTSSLAVKIAAEPLVNHLFVFPPDWLKTSNLTMIETLLNVIVDKEGNKCEEFSNDTVNEICNDPQFPNAIERTKLLQLQARQKFKNNFSPSIYKDKLRSQYIGSRAVIFLDFNHSGYTYTYFHDFYKEQVLSAYERWMTYLKAAYPKLAESGKISTAVSNSTLEQLNIYLSSKRAPSLRFLTDCLSITTRATPLVVIDNYDRPILEAHLQRVDDGQVRALKRFLKEEIVKLNGGPQVCMAGRTLLSEIPHVCVKPKKGSSFWLHSRLTNDNYAKFFAVRRDRFETMSSKLLIDRETVDNAVAWLDGYHIRRSRLGDAEKKPSPPKVKFADGTTPGNSLHVNSEHKQHFLNPKQTIEFFQKYATWQKQNEIKESQAAFDQFAINVVELNGSLGELRSLKKIFQRVSNLKDLMQLIRKKNVEMNIHPVLTDEHIYSLYQFAKSGISMSTKMRDIFFSFLYQLGVVDAKLVDASANAESQSLPVCIQIPNRNQDEYLISMAAFCYHDRFREGFLSGVEELALKICDLTDKCLVLMNPLDKAAKPLGEEELQDGVKDDVENMRRAMEQYAGKFNYKKFKEFEGQDEDLVANSPNDLEDHERTFHGLFDFGFNLPQIFNFVGSEVPIEDAVKPSASDACDSMATAANLMHLFEWKIAHSAKDAENKKNLACTRPCGMKEYCPTTISGRLKEEKNTLKAGLTV
uniref:Uncharacterized protein n=1 Tax=Ditylenchus dipsaci TaxID=166011 RepID=A0A915D2N7_9BILA